MLSTHIVIEFSFYDYKYIRRNIRNIVTHNTFFTVLKHFERCKHSHWFLILKKIWSQTANNDEYSYKLCNRQDLLYEKNFYFYNLIKN